MIKMLCYIFNLNLKEQKQKGNPSPTPNQACRSCAIQKSGRSSDARLTLRPTSSDVHHTQIWPPPLPTPAGQPLTPGPQQEPPEQLCPCPRGPLSAEQPEGSCPNLSQLPPLPAPPSSSAPVSPSPSPPSDNQTAPPAPFLHAPQTVSTSPSGMLQALWVRGFALAVPSAQNARPPPPPGVCCHHAAH